MKMRVAIYTRVLLALYCSAITGVFLWVPWQRQFPAEHATFWVPAGYHWCWWAVYDGSSVFNRALYIDAGRIGIELAALTAAFAAALTLLNLAQRLFNGGGK
jgi:hypothetical protein